MQTGTRSCMLLLSGHFWWQWRPRLLQVAIYGLCTRRRFIVFGEIAPRLRGAQSAGSLPAGSIIDWWQQDSSTPVPSGWALCNGQTAVWQTGSRAGQSFTTPNFIGMLCQGGDLLDGSSTANPGGYGNQPSKSTVGSGTTGTDNAYTGVGNGTGENLFFAYYIHEHSFQPPSIVCAKIIKL
jgi:hypothetical protein